MRLFEIDFDRLVRLILPVRLRGPRLSALLGSMVAPVKTVYAAFASAREKTLYQLDHSSQVCHLRAVLNDAFDATLRRIKVVDGPDFNPVYVYRRDENKPQDLRRKADNAPIALYSRAETYLGDDFLVKVPAGLVFDENQMRALIDLYRLASKKDYRITTL